MSLEQQIYIDLKKEIGHKETVNFLALYKKASEDVLYDLISNLLLERTLVWCNIIDTDYKIVLRDWKYTIRDITKTVNLKRSYEDIVKVFKRVLSNK